MQEPLHNIDLATVRDFGLEWQRFDQSKTSPEERARLFAEYFAIFPWQSLPAEATGFDAGCGSGFLQERCRYRAPFPRRRGLG